MKELFSDISQGMKQHYIWLMFGWYDVKLKYRRSLLGPFWLTISIAVMIVVMSLLYSQMFAQPLTDYLSFVGTSLVIWFFMMITINEGCVVLINADAQLTDTYLPLTTYVMRFIWRNLIIFFHNFIVVILIVLVFRMFHLKLLLFPIMLVLVSIFFAFFVLVLSMLCARFRDFPQMIMAITQVLMFVTPVFWKREFLEKHQWVVFMNPIYHLLEILRTPILNQPFPYISLAIVIFLILILMLISSIFVKRYKYRVPYWVG